MLKDLEAGGLPLNANLPSHNIMVKFRCLVDISILGSLRDEYWSVWLGHQPGLRVRKTNYRTIPTLSLLVKFHLHDVSVRSYFSHWPWILLLLVLWVDYFLCLYFTHFINNFCNAGNQSYSVFTKLWSLIVIVLSSKFCLFEMFSKWRPWREIRKFWQTVVFFLGLNNNHWIIRTSPYQTQFFLFSLLKRMKYQTLRNFVDMYNTQYI